MKFLKFNKNEIETLEEKTSKVTILYEYSDYEIKMWLYDNYNLIIHKENFSYIDDRNNKITVYFLDLYKNDKLYSYATIHNLADTAKAIKEMIESRKENKK